MPTIRNLKVEFYGDFPKYRKQSQIRLKGKWLKEAGFIPESYVSVSSPEPGTLIIKIKEFKNG